MMLLSPLKLTSCSSSLCSFSSSLSITSSSSRSITRLMTMMTAAAPAAATMTRMITTVSTTKTKATFLSTLSLSINQHQQQQKHERLLLSTTTTVSSAYDYHRRTGDAIGVPTAGNNFNLMLFGSSKRLMSTSSTTSDKNSNNNKKDEDEENSLLQEKEQEEEQPSDGTITGSITFAAETDEEYLSKEENEQSVDGGIDINNIDYSLYTEPIIIEMPQLDDVGGDTTNCYIDEWYKKEGDIIYSGDVICDISSPDFIFGMQIDDDGTGILKKYIYRKILKFLIIHQYVQYIIKRNYLN